MPAEEQGLIAYPIQPTFIVVRELYFVSHRPPSAQDRIDESSIHITQSATPFDEATRRVQVTLTAEYGLDQPGAPPPFSVRVAIIGEFSISHEFPADKIQQWVGVNAGFVIYPYLRERVYYLTSQGGYPPIMLPLLQIPTMKLEGGKFGIAGKAAAKPIAGKAEEKLSR
jgi:preprotein translocase subunit SecB